MNDSISSAVGTPAPIVIGGKTYTASPVDLFSLGEIEQAFRMRILSAAMFAPAPSEMARTAMYTVAVRETMEVSFNDARVQGFLKSPPGALELIVCSLKQKHPEIDAKAMAAVLRGHVADIERIVATIFAISGFGDDAKSGEASGASGGTFPVGADPADHQSVGRTLRLDAGAVGAAHAAAG